jgi:predicted O-methyltransferase YrrM
MDHFYENIKGWFDFQDVYTTMVNTASHGMHFVEVGAYYGKSAAYMAVEIINSGKDIKFDCVDTWDFVPSQTEISQEMCEGLYEIFLKNIEPVKNKITPIKALSWDGAAFYEDNSLDFVFIDAAHDYESVKKDINAWFPKVKKGGVIAGHDYTWCADVQKAVNEFFKGKTIYETEGCWSYFTEE